jgi:putative ABC transport system substrate-binding protein
VRAGQHRPCDLGGEEAFGGAVAEWPIGVYAQADRRLPVVGMLDSYSRASEDAKRTDAIFDDKMRSLGWVAGKNFRLERRWTGLDPDRYPALAKELVALGPDIIVAMNTATLRALRRETQSIPLVFSQVSDPVSQGFVASLAHPGGNITGFALYEFSIGGKWLSLLREVAPDVARVMFLFNPDTSPQAALFQRSIEAAGPAVGISVVPVAVHKPDDIDPAVRAFAQQPNGAMIVATDGFLSSNVRLVIGSATDQKLPTIFATPQFVTAGGLLYYGADVSENVRGAATYVDRILKGEKPGDLPVQSPVNYRFFINLKTAKMLGLVVPRDLLNIADEVIE